MATDKEKENAIEAQCRALIHSHQFAEAAKVMQNYRVPLHDYWGELDLSHNLVVIYKFYENCPDQLRGLSPEYYQLVHEELTYTWLRGNNTIRRFYEKPTNVPGLTVGIAMKILMNRSCQLRDIEEWRKSDVIIGAEIIDSKHDLCPECKKLCGKYDLFDNIPAIPNPKCLNADPCLPAMISIVGVREKPKKKGLFGLFK